MIEDIRLPREEERMRRSRAGRAAKQRLTQEDLAAKLQIAGVIMERDSVSRIEIGTRFVTDYELMVLSKVLDVSMQWLVGIDE